MASTWRKLHVLHHAEEEDAFGGGLITELARHGYDLGPGTLDPTPAKVVTRGPLTSESRVVQHKRRKDHRITPAGRAQLEGGKDKPQALHHALIEEATS